MSILVIRLGAMGDIIHALPAAASLKLSFPERKVLWLIAPKWMPLVEGNPFVDELILFDWRGTALWSASRQLRRLRPELAIDFQGLLKSSLAGRMARPQAFFGFDRSVARESLSTWLYSRRVAVAGPHRVQRNLQLAAAAGAATLTEQAWIPSGRAEANLPSGPFVLASPFAGWTSKQWPLESYEQLAGVLNKEGFELVINVSESQAARLRHLNRVRVHMSSLTGLIDATRRATAVIGVDSGPLHLAAALGKPGVALYGPTDPAQTGPYRSNMVVLRAPGVQTTYKRHSRIHTSMAQITVERVARGLLESLACAATHSS
ncbi:MAG TPA: glycosyltransferase family 9 protein [Bryobacteraceae bacterium]|jgi:heptosyltransferase-1